MCLVNPLSGDAPYFSILLCLTINSTREKKELSRIGKELKSVWSRWPSGKDKVLQVCEARFEPRSLI